MTAVVGARQRTHAPRRVSARGRGVWTLAEASVECSVMSGATATATGETSNAKERKCAGCGDHSRRELVERAADLVNPNGRGGGISYAVPVGPVERESIARLDEGTTVRLLEHGRYQVDGVAIYRRISSIEEARDRVSDTSSAGIKVSVVAIGGAVGAAAATAHKSVLAGIGSRDARRERTRQRLLRPTRWKAIRLEGIGSPAGSCRTRDALN